MKNLVNKGFKYFVAIMMVFSLMSMNAWANGPESGTSSETGSTTTENKGTTKDTGDSQGDTADQLISNEEKKTNTSKESDDKEGQTDQTTDKKTDYTYEDKKISVKAVLANASAISDQAELRVKEIPESTTEYKKYQEALNKKSNLYSNVLLYDISFMLNGKEVEPTDGNVKVSMSFKDQQLSDDLNVKDNNDLKVIHFKDNDVNKQETLNANTNVNKGTTSFETKSFSTYAVTDGPYNLSDKGWVTSVGIEKKENGEWKAANSSTTFKDGDDARISISYKIPVNSIQGNGSVVTYQIPNGIKVSSERSGPVLENPDDPSSISYGTYTVSTDGLITIKFNDKYDPSVLYNGNVTFQGKIDKSKAGESGKINFPGSDTSITISKDDKPEESKNDIKMTKSSELLADKKSINYTVTASTTNGTASTVDISDQFSWYQNVNVEYDQSSMRVLKVENGHKQAVNCTPTFGYNTNNNNKPYFEIKNLQKLNAGESYIVTYKANLNEIANTNGDIYVKNIVRGTSGKDSNYSSSSQHMERMINKYGQVTGNNIRWEVTLNDGHRDLKTNHYNFTDQLPYGLTLTDNIKVYYYNDQNQTVEVPILETVEKGASNIYIDFSRVDENIKNKKFKIEYYTNAPTIPSGKNKVSVSNTGKFQGDGHSYEATGSVDVTPINKQANGIQIANDKIATCSWNVTMGLTGESITGFTYKDIIKNAKNKDDSSDSGNSSHYAIAKKLYDLFNTKDVLQLKGYNQNIETTYVAGEDYTWTLVCYDKDNRIISNSDESTLVKSFEIEVKSKSRTTFKPTNFAFNYKTYSNLSNLQEGKTYVYENTGKIVEHNGSTVTNKESTAQQEYKYYSKIKKLASETGKENTYSNNNLNVDLKKTNGTINYRILVTIDKGQRGDCTVTDELPEGMRFDKDSLKFRFYKNGYELHNLSVEDKLIVNETTTKDGKTLISFTYLDGYEFNDKDSWQIAIDYKGVVSNDSDWNDMTKTEKSYTNTATWGDSSSSQTTKVTRTVEVSKSAQRLKGASGSDTNTVEYYVDINPSGSDLIPGSDTLTLSDTLTVSGGVQAYLDLDNVHLYQYDHSKDKHMGSELDKSLYSLTYNSETHKMEVELPDSQACVFVYRYTINTGNLASDSTTISNEANLNGEYSSNSNFSFAINSSSASLSGKKVTLEKVDVDNNTVFLKGAKFSIEKRENGNWVTQSASDVTSSNYLTTGDDGKISFTNLADDTLYRIKETEAPEGYRLPTNKYYYLIQTNGTIKDSVKNDLYSKLDEVAKKEIHDINNVLFFGKGTGKFYVPNTAKRLTVNKSWVHKDNTSSDPGESQVKMTLTRYLKSGNNLTKTDWNDSFVLSNDNNWTKYWDDLAADDGNGHEYVYKVEEEAIDGYEAIYRGNDVNHGTIKVINKGEKKTILPSTGGNGTNLYYQVGMLLSMLGFIYVVIKKIKGGTFKKKEHS